MVPIKQKVGTLPAWSVPAREHRVRGRISGVAALRRPIIGKRLPGGRAAETVCGTVLLDQ